MAFNYEEIFGNFNNAEINVYLVKYDKRSENSSWARLLPGDNNFNIAMLDSYGRYLFGFQDRDIEQFNPVGNGANGLATLSIARVQENWNFIMRLVRDVNNADRNTIRQANEGEENLLVTEVLIGEQNTYFISKYSNATKLFKFKNVFMSEEGRLVQKDADNLLAINYNIDIAINNGTAYLFNIGNFMSVFDYDEHMRQATTRLAPSIQQWRILGNSDVFLTFATKKYFYQGIAKIAEDATYLGLIQNFDPQRLKTTLIEKSNGIFTVVDFNENGQLVVTTGRHSNCKNIIKMLAREFKFNVFEEIMEE